MKQKHLIIKADDYGRLGANIDPWRRFFDVALNLSQNVSIGVVAEHLGSIGGMPHVTRYLRSLREEYDFEIWNHSNSHRDFRELSEEIITSDILTSQARIEAELGVRPKIFGPPFNYMNGEAARFIVATGEFSGYYCMDGFVEPSRNIAKKYLSSVEYGTDQFRPIRDSRFYVELERRQYPELLVLQLHPFYWTPECYRRFEAILKTLKRNGYQSIASLARVEYQSAYASRQSPVYGRSVGNVLHAEEQLLDAFASGDIVTEGVDASYYKRIISEGVSEIRHFLCSLGYLNSPLKHGLRRQFLDIGTGTGNWAVALSTINDALVIAIDREDRNIKLTQPLFPESSIVCKLTDARKIDVADGVASGLVCNNALSYMPMLEVLREFSRVSLAGAPIFLGLQTPLYPIRDALGCIERADYGAALQFLTRVVDSEGYFSGARSRPFVVYPNLYTLQAYAFLSGLKLQRFSLSVPGNRGELEGIPIFVGYLLFKTDAALKNYSAFKIGTAKNVWAAAMEAIELSGNIHVGGELDLSLRRSGRSPEFYFRACKLLGRETQRTPIQIGGVELSPLHNALLNLIEALADENVDELDDAVALTKSTIVALDDSTLAYWD